MMATPAQSQIDSLLQDLATAASSTFISNGAVIFHILNTNSESKFKKKDFGRTTEVICCLIGENTPNGPEPNKIRLKCKDTYNRFCQLKKHMSQPSAWSKLVDFLSREFYRQTVTSVQLDHIYEAREVDELPEPTAGPLFHVTLNTPLSQHVTSHPPSPKKLKGDCENCANRRQSLKVQTEALRNQKSIAYTLRRQKADMTRVYGKRTIDQRHRRHKIRVKTLVGHNKELLSKIEKLEKSGFFSVRKKKLLMKNDTLERENANLKHEVSILKEKVQKLEEECRHLHFQFADQEMMSNTSSSSNTVEAKEGKSFSRPIRESVYLMLCRQVPVEACGPVLKTILAKVANKTLTAIPFPSTCAQMSYELGISSLQVASHLMEAENGCLSWDATSVDGSHKELNCELIELHCNVHPMDAFANRSKAQLTAIDAQHDTAGKCYGKEGCAANLIQAVAYTYINSTQ
ncbi:hypothetical protein EGW08_005514 [Elysia chlorotica]|uniref:Uncharacterized protein n=1 Tax=Elysia chlorotica TaxID=188477 RepID=A0A433TYR3_ELYCH|nr:hypothetical protein EGW08_005514 [Elysia chlorotica]